jgi:DnaK suppressor protein
VARPETAAIGQALDRPVGGSCARESYMKSETILKFKNLFESQKREIIGSRAIVDTAIILDKDDMFDDVDMTAVERETTMRTRLLNRESLFLKKIEGALRRISDGSFGVCEGCDDDIEVKRLEARPTATLCVSCKEAEERREHAHIDGHKHKSVGVRLRLA